ncbi:hypothetical protein P9F85_14290 [Bacillus stercoris]|nr:MULTISPECIES: hypothetical protein [unclassified Bacillus (in: firmicutes)]MDN0192270.1 hypothetical protein [Bacillus sp. B.PNR1]MDN3033176.1 hypothetical protein [Bacillus sp. B.PNR2]MEC2112409.1 hypothetical protein [Bacillus stercoris]MEC3616092.1 hypothetical protein [Bacillus stercoris]
MADIRSLAVSYQGFWRCI